MPTDVTNSIGSSSRTYSTVQLWEDAAPTDLTTSRTNTTVTGSTSSTIMLDALASSTTDFYKGHPVWCTARPAEIRMITAYNGTTKVATITGFNGSSNTWDNTPSVETFTVDSVRYIGQCYNDSEFSAGTPLVISGETTSSSAYMYLQCASGQSFKDNAGVRTNALFYNQTNGVGIKATANYSVAITTTANYCRLEGLQVKASSAGGACVNGAGTNTLLDKCILYDPATNQAPCTSGPNGTMINCCVISNYGSGNIGGWQSAATIIAYGCTFVKIGTAAGTGLRVNYGNVQLKNCAILNFSTTANDGYTSSSYNASTTTISGGTNNQASLTFANEVVNTSTDFRALSTGHLPNNGTPDSTNTPDDITGTTRSASTPTIGCWEILPSSLQFPSFIKSQALNRSINY